MAGALTAMIAAAFAGGVTPDPYYEYTTLLLPGSGTNGAQNNTFLDGSTNNFTITRNGNTTQGTFSPFSQTGWGNYFNGSSAFGTSDVATDFQSGDFTIEAWVYLSSLSTVAPVVNGSNTSVGLQITTNAELELFQWTGSAYSINIKSSVSAVALNTWVHVVGVRSGSNASVYVNGSRLATSTTVSGTQVSTGSTLVGRNSGSTRWVSGYISNLRIVKGTAVYDPTQTTLTVPTAPLTAISGTSLLTCQSNRFIDNSTNNFAITVNGNTSVQAFSPFNPLLPWTAANNGGSGYFDGSGDYLQMPSNAAFQFGTGDFCLEAWIYPTNSGTTRAIWGQRGGSSGDNAWILAYNPANAGSHGYIYFHTNITAVFGTSISVAANSWTHVVFTCVSGRYRIFQNGVLAGTTTGSYNFSETTGPRLGAEVWSVGIANFLGYIATGRITKGGIPSAYSTSSTTVGTQIFTPPTTPSTSSDSLTAGSLSVLLNFTNAGVYDATSKNDLETVGTSQISTAQYKFPTSSIWIPGSNAACISEPSSTNYGYGTGDFTIEFWIRFGSTGSQTIFSNLTTTASVAPHIYISSGTIKYYTASADRITSSSVTTGVWYHFALCRSGSSTKMFLDGTQTGSTYTDTNNYGASNPLGIGDYGYPPSGGSRLDNGYLQDVRVSKYARYTANFTAPTAAFPTL